MRIFLNMIKEFFGKLFGKPPGGFALGDKVSWGGVIGTVVATQGSVNGNGKLQVLFMGPKLIVGFESDGRFLTWHKATDLKFLARQRFVKQAKVASEDKTTDGKQSS